MADVTALHRAAMDLADEGDRLRRRGELEAAQACFARAFESERRAALEVEVEPSRGILHRSAAWLALEADRARDAEVMAARGLAGSELAEGTAAELRAVLEDAQLRLHRTELAAPGATAAFELTLKGGDIGYGDADPAQVMKRIDLGQRLLHRTLERRVGRPFRAGAAVPTDIVERASSRLRVAPGSFTLRFELGGRQLSLWDEAQGVVADLIGCFHALAADDAEALEDRIPDPSYRQNFVALARRIGPDGKAVTKVSVSGSTATGVQRLVLGEPAPRDKRRSGDGERVVVVGILLAADGTRKRSSIKLVADDGKMWTVTVDDALLEDIVRPYFGRSVRAELLKRTASRGAPKFRLLDLDDSGAEPPPVEPPARGDAAGPPRLFDTDEES